MFDYISNIVGLSAHMIFVGDAITAKRRYDFQCAHNTKFIAQMCQPFLPDYRSQLAGKEKRILYEEFLSVGTTLLLL